MKHYVITRGYYSDYRIIAVCAYKTDAKKIAERIDRESYVDMENDGFISDKCRIEEYEDGKVLYNESLTPFFVNFDRGVVEKDDTENVLRKNIIELKGGHILGMSVFAKDEQEALKIASDKKAMLMAQKEEFEI